MKTELQGDYIGFTFGGVSSSSLGIVRVSDGDRYTKDLFPSFTDRTANVTGGNGVYYFGTDYSQRQISLSIAYDCVEESEIRKMQQVFAPDGTLKELWFNELPYKAVMAKVSGTPQLKYLPFDEIYVSKDAGGAITETKKRVYKGTGTIQFTVYSPFAFSRFKFLNEAKTSEITNKDEWLPSVALKETKGNYDGSGATVDVYNPGDLSVPCKIYFTLENFKSLTKISLGTVNPEAQTAVLNFQKDKGLEDASTEGYVCIDSKTCLVERCDKDYNKTGVLYNRFITSGDFFLIPTNASVSGEQRITSTGASIAKVEYDYLYYA